MTDAELIDLFKQKCVTMKLRDDIAIVMDTPEQRKRLYALCDTAREFDSLTLREFDSLTLRYIAPSGIDLISKGLRAKGLI